jgi:hypothetical protein
VAGSIFTRLPTKLSEEAIFEGGLRVDGPELKRQESELFEQIGRLKMELEWLKKKYGALRSSNGAS